MTKIKGIIFDIDNTIYSNKIKGIPELTEKAIHDLKEKGYIICVCTSRSPHELNSIEKDFLNLFDLVVCGTGCILMQQNKIIKAYDIDNKVSEIYINYFDENNIPYNWIAINGEQHFSKLPEERWQKHYIEFCGSLPTVQKWNKEKLYTIAFSNVNEVQMHEILNLSEEVKVQAWGTFGLINRKGVDKAFGVKEFARMFNLSLNEIACFGDDENDISMFDIVGCGIAVGNANDELVKHANYVTDDIEKGGIYNACVKEGWIQRDNSGIRMIFFDIDGTSYLRTIHDLPESAKDAMSKLKEKGYLLGIATSRTYQEMRELPKSFINSMDAIICDAGGQIKINNKNYFSYLDEKEVEKGIKYLDENDVIYRWADEKGSYFAKETEEMVERFNKMYDMCPPEKKYTNEKLIHILYFSKDEKIIDEINKIFGKANKIHYGYGHELVPENMDKSTSIAFVANKYGYTLENCAAFGDGHNDVKMLKEVKIGIAMGNACDPCKEVADYITDNIEDDGLYKACKQFGWI